MSKNQTDKEQVVEETTEQETIDKTVDNKETEKEENSSKKKSKRGSRGGAGNSKKVQELEANIELLNKEKDELKDKYLRLFAEFDNYKRRTSKERLELLKTAASDTVLKLLPVIDDFDRAAQAASSGNDEPFSEGVQLVHNKLNSIANQIGLKAMETNGQAFDAELHEAITEIPAPSEEMKGKIIDTVEKGYTLGDKIIRYPKVVVGK